MNGSVLYLSPQQRTTRYYAGENKSSIFPFGLTQLMDMTKMFKLFHNTAREPNSFLHHSPYIVQQYLGAVNWHICVAVGKLH